MESSLLGGRRVQRRRWPWCSRLKKQTFKTMHTTRIFFPSGNLSFIRSSRSIQTHGGNYQVRAIMTLTILGKSTRTFTGWCKIFAKHGELDKIMRIEMIPDRMNLATRTKIVLNEDWFTVSVNPFPAPRACSQRACSQHVDADRHTPCDPTIFAQINTIKHRNILT